MIVIKIKNAIIDQNLNGILYTYAIRKKVVPNVSNRWHCKCQNMKIKIPIMDLTHSSCYKNVEYMSFPFFRVRDIRHDSFNEGSCSDTKAFFQE